MKGFRARLQKSGKTYYYFDTGKKELPLGSDYVLAVKKWVDLTQEDAPDVATFIELADRYEREVLVLKAKSTPVKIRMLTAQLNMCLSKTALEQLALAMPTNSFSVTLQR